MDADAVRKQKDRAAELVAKGKLPAALEAYRGLLRDLPGDLSLRQKVADLLNRTGNPRAAIAEYDAVVQAYAERGELLKAISLAKVILQIDPRHRATEAKLAELYSRQMEGGPRFTVSPPLLGRPAPPVAAAPEVESPFAPTPPLDASGPLPNEPTRILRAAPPASSVAADVALEPPPGNSGDMTLIKRPAARPVTADAPPVPLTRPIVPVPLTRPIVPRAAPTPRPARPGVTFEDETPVSTARERVAFTGPGSSTLRQADPADEASSLDLDGMRDAEARSTGSFPAWREPTPDTDPGDTEFEHATIQGMVPIPMEAPGEESSLPKIPLFSVVPREAFVALVAGAQVRTAAPGERLVVEGSPGDSLFAVVQGLVTLRKKEGERERLFAAMGPGELFGELSVVTEAPRLATVVAEDDTVLLELPREQLQPILRDHPSVRHELESLSRERLYASIVRVTPLFDALAGEARERLQSSLEVRVVTAGEAVVLHGDPPAGLFVVLRGKLAIIDPAASASAPPLPDLEEGDLFGVLSSLLGEPIQATVAARTAGVLVQIAPAVVAELLPAQRVMRQLLAALARERWNALGERRASPEAG